MEPREIDMNEQCKGKTDKTITFKAIRRKRSAKERLKPKSHVIKPFDVLLENYPRDEVEAKTRTD